MVNWGNRSVVSDAHLVGVTVEASEVLVEFVDSTFDRCIFRDITANGAFWKSSNTWNDCLFERVNMTDLVAPENRFHSCQFRNSTIRQFVGYDTKFEECQFVDVLFETLSARQNRMRGKPFSTVPRESLVFRRCTFTRPSFDACRFDHVAFEDCSVEQPHIRECSFTGVTGSPSWWAGLPDTDPFLAFLSAVLAGIETELGIQSRAWSQMSEYVRRHENGETQSKDYSECLFDGVPIEEVDQIDELLDHLERRYRI